MSLSNVWLTSFELVYLRIHAERPQGLSPMFNSSRVLVLGSLDPKIIVTTQFVSPASGFLLNVVEDSATSSVAVCGVLESVFGLTLELESMGYHEHKLLFQDTLTSKSVSQ